LPQSSNPNIHAWQNSKGTWFYKRVQRVVKTLPIIMRRMCFGNRSHPRVTSDYVSRSVEKCQQIEHGHCQNWMLLHHKQSHECNKREATEIDKRESSFFLEQGWKCFNPNVGRRHPTHPTVDARATRWWHVSINVSWVLLQI